MKSQQEKNFNIISKAISVHGDKYNYSKTEYVNKDNKIIIICSIHGEFSQLASNHIHRKAGCPSCSKPLTVMSRLNTILSKKFKDLIQPEEYKLIPLTQGKFAIVDNEDFDKVVKYSWSLTSGKNYAENRKFKQLHKFILKPTNGLVVDHINGDGLDNRRSNLRVCTQAENCRNQRVQNRNKSSVYKGVSWNKKYGKWEAYVHFKGIKYICGYFNTEEDASIAYNKKASELFGEFAKLNKI